MYLNLYHIMKNFYSFLNWTLTWDVFKCPFHVGSIPATLHWTLTWDVFK